MDIKMGFHKIAPCYYPGWHEPATELQYLINQRVYDRLPPEYQANVKIAMQAVAADMYNENFDASANAWMEMKKDYPNIKIQTSEMVE